MYFGTIRSFADLKLQYRKLALQYHPDKGGDTRKMQEINAEFGKLFDYWKNREVSETDTRTGYENDYAEAKTSTQYADYVWNEYRWKGENCGKIPTSELPKHFREWVKKTYPNCKFSITKGNSGWNYSFYINLYQADFECFENPDVKKADYNHYHHSSFEKLTPRCQEVMRNVVDYVMSYNYDRSDSMTDYFDVGFYVTFTIGTDDKNFKYVPKMLKSKDAIKRKVVGPIQKKINAAMKGCKWAYMKKYDREQERYVEMTDMPKVLCVDNDSNCEYALYSNRSYALQQAKVEVLRSVGILCDIENHRIFFRGYSEELQLALDAENQQ